MFLHVYLYYCMSACKFIFDLGYSLTKFKPSKKVLQSLSDSVFQSQDIYLLWGLTKNIDTVRMYQISRSDVHTYNPTAIAKTTMTVIQVDMRSTVLELPQRVNRLIYCNKCYAA